MKIAIGGFKESGKTTVAKFFEEILNTDSINVSDIIIKESSNTESMRPIIR